MERLVLMEVYVMSKYRFCYAKEDGVKYVSHLDFIRTVERAMKRGHFPVAHSQGFNPHPSMAVAVPLSVGLTSKCEYMDIGFDEPMDNLEELKERFNAVLPEGFHILEIKDLEKEELAKFKFIDIGEYEIYVEYDGKTLPDIEKFMGQEEIVIPKRSKKGLSDVDIKPLIHEFYIKEQNDFSLIFFAKIAAGQVNLKPQLIITALCKYQPEFHGEFLSARRLKLISSEKVCF